MKISALLFVLTGLLYACGSGTGGSIKVDKGGFKFFFPKHWEPTGELWESGKRIYAGEGNVFIKGSKTVLAEVEFGAVKTKILSLPKCDTTIPIDSTETSLLNAFRSKYSISDGYCADLGNTKIIYYQSTSELRFDYLIDSVLVSVLLTNISEESGTDTHAKLLDEFDAFIQSFEPI